MKQFRNLCELYFITDHNKKLIVGWSTKAGCTHIKNMMFQLVLKNIYKNVPLVDTNALHIAVKMKPLPENIDDFTIVLIVRNPYKRLVSGFIDKYSMYDKYYRLWDPSVPLTFSNFVDEIEKTIGNISNLITSQNKRKKPLKREYYIFIKM